MRLPQCGPMSVGRSGGSLADLTHTVRAEAQHPLYYRHQAASSAPEAAAMFRDLVEGAGRDLADVQVLAVGLPGPIDRETGRTASPAILPGWAEFDVRSAIEATLGVRTIVDNDANLGALGEGAQ